MIPKLKELVVVATIEAVFLLAISLLLQDRVLQYFLAAIFGITIIVILMLPRRGLRGISALRALRSYEMSERAEQRSHDFYHMIHLARNLSVSLMPIVPPYQPKTANPSAPDPILEAHKIVIIQMLDRLAKIFSKLAPPGTKIWTSLRDRRADDCYHTFARAGRFDIARAGSSKAMHKDRSIAVAFLKKSYIEGSCVFISGSTTGPQTWEQQVNDDYGEDKSILMGAVMTKSPVVRGNDEEWKNWKLTWILYVNADTENAFDHKHLWLMRCCVIAFAWLANSMIREPYFGNPGNSGPEQKPPNAPPAWP